jgi:parallel beta-helix repeat protein
VFPLENRLFFRESNIQQCYSTVKRIGVNMKKQVAKMWAISVILLTAFVAINFQVDEASNVITVPDNYSTITAAIAHAHQGDTVLVKKGIYYENLRVDQSITLQGEDSKTTIIIGQGGADKPSVLTMAADGVKVFGFTIESVNMSNPSQNAYGINIQGDHCTITNNVIKNNYIGIFSACQSYTTIANNTITKSIKDGIRFYSGTQNNVSDNTINANAVSGVALGGYTNFFSRNNLQGNTRGLGLGASNSVVFGNTFTSNIESGIFLSGSKNIISSNDIAANKYGIYITTQGAAPRANEIYQNNFLTNSFNAYGNSTYLIENWDNGSSGNYWSDDQSAPYIINSNNIDNHPLTTPFDTLNLGNPPTPIPAVATPENGIVASWTFDNIEYGWVIPDETGNNPAVLGSTVGENSFVPEKVQGKFGQALDFNGSAYAFVPPSASLQTPQEVTLDAWVNVKQIKGEVAYNNIMVECLRTTASLPIRTLGLAINGETPQNESSPSIGALRGYIVTQDEVLNEIDTTQPIPLNQWVHIVFTRSLTTGMHIYVNGNAQAVTVFSGAANPSGTIERQNELYIGHDSITQIDQLQITNTVYEPTQQLWMQWWLWVAIAFLAIGSLSIAIYFKKRG